MNDNSTLLVVAVVICVGLFILQGFTSRLYLRKRRYAIEPGGEKRLEIRSNSSWRRLAVWFDGALVGEVAKKKNLSNGVEFQLPNQMVLRIQLLRVYATWSELQVWCDGKPLQDFTPFTGTNLKMTKAIGAVFLVGLLPCIWLLTLVFVRFVIARNFFIDPVEMPFILAYIGWSILYFALAFFSQKGSLFAMSLAVILFTLDGILGTWMYFSAGWALSAGSVGGLLTLFTTSINLLWGIAFLAMHIFLLSMMIPGFSAMLANKKSNSAGSKISFALFVLILIGGSIAVYYLADSGRANNAVLKSFYNQVLSSVNVKGSGQLTPTLAPVIKVTQSARICWTREVTGFSGNRSQAWTTILDAATRDMLPHEQFVQDTLVYNPQLIADGYVFIGTKKYLFPKKCP